MLKFKNQTDISKAFRNLYDEENVNARSLFDCVYRLAATTKGERVSGFLPPPTQR